MFRSWQENLTGEYTVKDSFISIDLVYLQTFT